MEEKKLLRILILIIINFTTEGAYANDIELDAKNWADNIANRDHQMIMNNFKDMMTLEGFDQDLRKAILNPRPLLQIFVSRSMPQELLKSYAREASYFNGVLVFCGLPEGSFRKLTDLVAGITDANHVAMMQIDDEAFRMFDVKIVPTIVLSKPNSMFDAQSKLQKFDKVEGNISIKGALELFAANGDLQLLAREMLK